MWLRPKFWPTFFALAGLVVLLSLGSWQLQRLAWKNGFLERLQSRMAAAAVVMPDDPVDLERFEFRRIFVAGEFDHDREMYLLNRVVNGVVGGNIITPLRREGIGSHILVDRGWVPQSLRDLTTRPESQVSRVVTVEAIVRGGHEKNLFTPDNDPASNDWYFVDPAAMAAVAGIDAPVEYF
jgi:surfeit locus 1 family protein